MSRVYTTYEAKARFSELLRQVRSGQRVRISYRGEEVAEVRPLAPPERSFADHLGTLEQRGVLTPKTSMAANWRPLARRPGALHRFLESRD